MSCCSHPGRASCGAPVINSPWDDGVPGLFLGPLSPGTFYVAGMSGTQHLLNTEDPHLAGEVESPAFPPSPTPRPGPEVLSFTHHLLCIPPRQPSAPPGRPGGHCDLFVDAPGNLKAEWISPVCLLLSSSPTIGTSAMLPFYG